jgi:flagellar M-ring protein FliF
MPASLKQLAALWGRLKGGQRFAVLGGGAAALAVVAALVYYGSRPEYGVLFGDMKPEDAQAVVERLKAANVPYQLSNGGTTVSVPQERVSEMRLQVASSGALSGGHVGFDLFDRNSFGATDFAQQVNYQRALEGELARTLEGMDEVEAARVHVTRPQESLFADKERRAKASVVLRVRANRELSRERTDSVVSLLASAVEGLDPSDVSVMDARGRLLSAARQEGLSSDAGAFNSHLEARRRFEAETAARVVSLIEPITGAGNVRADVAAELDFSRVEQTEEKYNPQSAVIRSQQTSQEVRGAGGAAGVGGVAGTRANDPAAPAAPAQTQTAPAGGAQRVASTTNYEIDKTVRRTVGAGGTLTRMSVSVVVDFKAVEGVSTARTPEELQKIQQLVAAAVGTNEGRGDQVVVQSIPFERPASEAAAQPFVEKYRDLLPVAVKYSLLLLAALFVVLFALRPMRRALRAAAAQNSPALMLPAGEAAGGQGAPPAALAGAGDAAAMQQLGDAPRTVAEIEAEMEAEVAREVAASLVPEVKRAGVLKKQLSERSEVEPEMIAMTIRGWLRESK